MKTIVRFCIDQIPSIEPILKEGNIPYEIYNDSAQLCGITTHYNKWIFKLQKDSHTYQAVINELEAQGSDYKGHASLVFTKKEIDQAEWLYVRATCMKVDSDESVLSFAKCANPQKGACFARHRISPIYCDRKIKWDNRHFFYASYYYGYAELFCSEAAKEKLQSGGFPLAYESLFRSKPPHEVLPDLYHIVPCNVLPAEAFSTEHMKLQTDCPYCAIKTYEVTDDVQLAIDHRYLQTDALIYRSLSIFGPGWSRFVNVISKEGRRFLIENRMDRGLLFVPIRVY